MHQLSPTTPKKAELAIWFPIHGGFLTIPLLARRAEEKLRGQHPNFP